MKILKVLIVFGALSLVSFTSVPAVKENSSKVVLTKITWKSESISLGKIAQGKPAEIEFSFKNEGNSPVLITEVKPSCGCTVANYTKEPILPGKSGKITATFNAAAKGAFSKNVTVITNAETNPKVLTFNGEVI